MNELSFAKRLWRSDVFVALALILVASAMGFLVVANRLSKRGGFPLWSYGTLKALLPYILLFGVCLVVAVSWALYDHIKSESLRSRDSAP